jgi:hypothetical protein
MVKNILVNGNKIKCMVKEKFHGVMEDHTMEIMKMIKNRDLVFLNEAIKENILVIIFMKLNSLN